MDLSVPGSQKTIYPGVLQRPHDVAAEIHQAPRADPLQTLERFAAEAVCLSLNPTRISPNLPAKPVISNQPSPHTHQPLRVIETDDAGWAAFKKLEITQRREYAQSQEAILDHTAWVNSPIAEDDEWGSVPGDEWVEHQIVPKPHEIPWEQLYDWSLERTKDDDRENP